MNYTKTFLARLLFKLQVKRQTVKRNGERSSTQLEVEGAVALVVVGLSVVLVAVLRRHL